MYINGNRVMAWIAKIEEIKSIPGADRICAYRTSGWWVVDQVARYELGDLAVYCSIDSWIPEAMAPFLSKGGGAKEYEGIVGNRLRTVKLRGTTSQGLLLPIKPTCEHIREPLVEGLDVTEQLGIVKYDPPIPACLAGEVVGLFPSCISKTDQERVQNLITEKDWFLGSWEVTLKLDGSSMTLFTHEGEQGVCSRNLWLKDNAANDGNTLIQFARSIDYTKTLADVADIVGFDFALQGEIMGPGIQKNREKFSIHRFFVFDVYNISASRYLSPSERKELLKILLLYANNIEHVPVIDDWFKVTEDMVAIDQFLAIAERPSINHKIAEGVVFKNLNDSDKSFKVISNAFLLREQ